MIHKNDNLQSSFFMHTGELALAYLTVFKNPANSSSLHGLFNKGFSHINNLCDEDDHSASVMKMSKRDLTFKRFAQI